MQTTHETFQLKREPEHSKRSEMKLTALM